MEKHTRFRNGVNHEAGGKGSRMHAEGDEYNYIDILFITGILIVWHLVSFVHSVVSRDTGLHAS